VEVGGSDFPQSFAVAGPGRVGWNGASTQVKMSNADKKGNLVEVAG